MRALLLGGTGFIGTATARALRAEGHNAVTVGRGPSADIQADASDPAVVAAILDSNRLDVVVNLLGAGLSAGTADSTLMAAVNTRLPAALPGLILAAAPHARLVHAASSTERLPHQDQHESEYSRTKSEGTLALCAAATDLGVPTTILSIHNTYGPGQPRERFIAYVINRLDQGLPVELRYPSRVRDFVLIDDVAACLIEAATRVPAGVEWSEAGTGTGTSLREASLRIAGVVGASASLVIDAAEAPVDPNPTTVAHDRYGTYGLCTTSLHDGLLRTIQED